jgi:epoxyqueuosine reductase
MSPTTTPELRRVATSLGASAFGVTGASRLDGALETLRAHRSAGLSGPLHFTYDEPEIATDVSLSYPWARNIVVIAHDYLPASDPPAATGAVVGRFATSDQYTPVRLIADGLAAELRAAGARAEVLVDDNRLVDRAVAARAGVGWLGKSTMLLAPGHGPWLLLGSVVTDAELSPTEPMRRTCGTCVACIPACPTGAITERGLDAGRCISTWLQTAGSIPRWIRPMVGRRIYGCDDCLTSCPPGHPSLRMETGPPAELSFAELLADDDDRLIERFGWFYVPHRDPRFLRRNLLVAAGNSEEAEAVGAILDHFTHRSALVRGHAYWALARSLGRDAWTPLRRRHAFESVPGAIDELEHSLLMSRSPLGG